MRLSETTLRRILEWTLIAVLLLTVYIPSGMTNATYVNDRLKIANQRAYLRVAENFYQNPTGYVFPRNRMPAYSILLSTLYESGLGQERFFWRAKLFNILLSSFCLALLFGVFRSELELSGAIALWMIVAFTVYVFKAGYVQAELLFYTLLFLAFYSMLKMFVHPTFNRAIMVGLFSALAQLTKASMLAGLAIFSVIFAIKILHEQFPSPWSNQDCENTAGHFGLFLIALTVFMVIMAPYIQTNLNRFGTPFYNVNSRFYMWTDSWGEAIRRTKAVGDRKSWPDLPSEKLPGPINYLKNHSFSEISSRIFEGSQRLLGDMVHSYGYLKYGLVYICALIVFGISKYRWLVRPIRNHIFVFLFVLFFLGGYTCLYIWYAVIVPNDRLILSIFIPFLFAIFRFLEVKQDPILSPWDLRITFKHLHYFVIIMVGIEVIIFLPSRIQWIYGGY